jgi:hypothetical protein
MSGRAIVGELSIELEDGRILTDRTDLGLAWKWAEAEHGELWPKLRAAEQRAAVSDALAALRAAYEANEANEAD